MDITGISGSNMNLHTAESQRRQTDVDSFQAILEKASQNQGGRDEKELKEIKNACEAFESYFLQMMFREMRKTSFNEDGFIAKSQAEEIFTDMLDEETAKSATKSGGIGLADMMYKQMTR